MTLHPVDETVDLDRTGRAARRRWLREPDRAADELFEKLAELHLTFFLQFGAGSSEELLGIEDDVPVEPPALYLVAREVYDSLLDPGLELPVQRLADLVVHPSRMAAALESPIRDLETALARVDRLLPDRSSAQPCAPTIPTHQAKESPR